MTSISRIKCQQIGSHVRAFSTAHLLLSRVDPATPNDEIISRIRKPGMSFGVPLDPRYRLGLNPLYRSPYADYIGMTKRWSFGVLGVFAYVGYLALDATGASFLWYMAGMSGLSLPLMTLHYYTNPHVIRIFRLYKKDEPQTFENLTKDETLVVEQIGALGRGTKATEIKVKGIKIVRERNGSVNWKYHDEDSKENVCMYVNDNIGGIKMDRIWGIIEKNSGIENGRSFLNERAK